MLPPDWVQTSKVIMVDGVQVGLIGAAYENTPELVSASATEGLKFLPVVPAVRANSPFSPVIEGRMVRLPQQPTRLSADE